MSYGFWRDRSRHTPTDWANVFGRVMERHSSWTIADIGALTYPQLILALGIDTTATRATTRDDVFAIFDAVAESCGLSPKGMMAMPLEWVNAKVEGVIAEWPGVWYLRRMLPAWARERSV